MLAKFWSWLLTLWSFFKMQIDNINKEHQPLKPQDTRALDKVREVQDLLDAGVSYRALGRQYGLTKAELKSLQRFNTGRFYFGSKENNVHSNKVLKAERADPVSGQLSSPAGVPLFGGPTQAWDWLRRKRIYETFSEDQKKTLANLRHNYPNQAIDPTPAGL